MPTIMQWNCHVDYRAQTDKWLVYMMEVPTGGDERYNIVQPLAFHPVKRAANGLLPDYDPMIELSGDDGKGFLQAIIDAAWRNGIRPTQYQQGSEAQQRHLEDMRALVFADKPTEKP